MKIQSFDYSANLLQAILWQYDNAENLLQLVQQQQIYFDTNHSEFWRRWYNDVFNLDTANEFGLVVWTIILGLPLFFEITPDNVNRKVFGFGPYDENFDNGTFTGIQQNGLSVSIEERRIILKLRYFYLTSRGSTVEMNENFDRIFAPLGRVYAFDNLDMTMTYQFTFTPSDNFLNILTFFNLLPTPAAVGYDYILPESAERITDDDITRITDDGDIRITDLM